MYKRQGEFSIDKTSDTVTVDQIVNFSERDVDVTFVYEYNYLTEEIEKLCIRDRGIAGKRH